MYGNNVYAASRVPGESKAKWKGRKGASLYAALNMVEKALERSGAELFGRIIMVEMTADDISAIEADQVPGARFRGQYRNEKDFGKFDFDKVVPGRRVKSQAMSDGVKNTLKDGLA